MSIKSFLKTLTSSHARRQSARHRPNRLPCLESLEDRCLLSVSPVVLYPVGLTPVASVTADFNNDGHADLLAINKPDSTMSVLLGNGDGTFEATVNSPTSLYAEQALAGDLNGDNKTDLVTVNSAGPGEGSLSVMLGNGDGTFQTPQRFWLPPQLVSSINAGQSASAAALGDLDADGRLDLVVSGSATILVQYGYDDYGNSIYLPESETYLNVLLGNGDGGFGPSTVYVGMGSHKLTVGDFNADGKLDVVTSRTFTLLGNGDGTLQTPLISPGITGGVLSDYLPVDFDGDGTLDLLMRDGTGNRLLLGLGNGDGTFRETEPVFERSAVQPAVAADVNSDGKLDIVMLQSTRDEDYRWDSDATVLLGNGDGTFALPIITDLGLPEDTYFNSAVLADFDGDGDLDVAGSVYEVRYPYYYDVNYETDHQGFIGVSLNDGQWTAPQPLPPTLTIGDAVVVEANSGTQTAHFLVTRSGASDQPVTVDFATADGSATAGSDYQAASGTLTFAPGQTSMTIGILISADLLFEPNETFVVNLTNAVGATIVDGQGVGTILNDDPAPPTLSINDVTRNEGEKGKTSFKFTVTLSAPSTQTVTVFFATADGTATVSGRDYTANSGTLTFLPGETSKTVTISVRGDRNAEADETFFVNLSSANGASINDGQGVGTILNDDGGTLSLDATFSDVKLMDELLTGRKRK